MSTRDAPLPLDEKVLWALLEGTAGATGHDFFRALVDNLKKALDTKGAWVTLFHPQAGTLEALAMKVDDEWRDGLVYSVRGTPCEPVVANAESVHVADRVIDLFPDDHDLAADGAVSYSGVPLLDTDGTVLGHLAVLDDRPMPEEPRGRAVLQIFAARAAAEHRRLRAERQMRERERQLAGLIDGAMDAIVGIDAEWRIGLANGAAERVFGATAGGLRGKRADLLFSEDSAARLRLAAEEISTATEENSHLWMADGLTGRMMEGTLFPAEATLSYSTSDGAGLFTLVLRNVHDRLLAERRIESLEREKLALREELDDLRGHPTILGSSPALSRALADLEEVAKTATSVLVLGETGTGKELFARAIHEASPRAGGPLIKVNCAAIPDSLMESELFGHERGAFTGATARRTGRFVLADGGTLFLDEVGELPLPLQAKLLRVLQEGEVEPVGSSETIAVDVRIVAATNRDLKRAVEAGEFRADLYYRLNVFPITVPPLRDRGDDVLVLAERFVDDCSRTIGKQKLALTASDRDRLRAYRWPGNIRELRNVIERAVILAQAGRINLDRALPLDAPVAPSPREAAKPEPEHPDAASILTADQLRQLERENIERALRRTDGKIAGADGAAALLGLKPSTLTSRMRALGITKKS